MFEKELSIDSRVSLSDGNSIPLLGLGTWEAQPGGETRDAVAFALEICPCPCGDGKYRVPWRNCVSPQRFRLPVHHQHVILPHEGNVRTCSQQVLQERLAIGIKAHVGKQVKSDLVARDGAPVLPSQVSSLHLFADMSLLFISSSCGVGSR